MKGTGLHDGRANRRERRAFEGLVVAFVAMLICFSASTLVTALRMNELTGHSEVVSGNALPGVLQLTRIRREVRRVERGLDDVVERRSPWDPEVVESAFGRIEVAVAMYRDTADFEGEAEAWARASDALRKLRASVARLAHHLSTVGADRNSSRLFEAEVGPLTDEVDDHLAELIDLNAVGGKAAAASVERSRTRIVRLALGLDLLSLLFSLGAVTIAIRAMRRHMRLVKERADELECFSDRVAHDIRGPLTPAMLALQRVETQAADETTKRLAQRGTKSLMRVQNIVNDLLVFAQSGGHPDLDATTSLRDAVTNTVSEVEPYAAERGTEIVAESVADVSIACAPGVLGSILSNLVRNGVKFMGAGPVRRVVVRATTTDGYACIEVEDTGPGIPAILQRVVFEPYVRGPRSAEGLGLGLATVKRLVEAHGGTISVHSVEGQGCTVRCRLPLRRAPSRGESGAHTTTTFAAR